MRMIDADALIAWIDVGHLRHPSELCYSELDVVNMINHAPTIEPQRQSGRKVYQAGYADGYKAGQEDRKIGKWVGIEEYCDHMNEVAAQKGKSTRYMPSGIYIGVYCNQCWKVNERSAAYCPSCGAKMEGEDDGSD